MVTSRGQQAAVAHVQPLRLLTTAAAEGHDARREPRLGAMRSLVHLDVSGNALSGSLLGAPGTVSPSPTSCLTKYITKSCFRRICQQATSA